MQQLVSWHVIIIERSTLLKKTTMNKRVSMDFALRPTLWGLFIVIFSSQWTFAGREVALIKIVDPVPPSAVFCVFNPRQLDAMTLTGRNFLNDVEMSSVIHITRLIREAGDDWGWPVFSRYQQHGAIFQLWLDNKTGLTMLPDMARIRFDARPKYQWGRATLDFRKKLTRYVEELIVHQEDGDSYRDAIQKFNHVFHSGFDSDRSGSLSKVQSFDDDDAVWRDANGPGDDAQVSPSRDGWN